MRTRPASSTDGIQARQAAALVSRLILAHDVGADAAAFRDLQACLPGPGPHGATVGRCAARAPGGTTAATRYPPSSLHVRGKGLFQLGPVLLGEIDFVGHAVEAERDRLRVV